MQSLQRHHQSGRDHRAGARVPRYHRQHADLPRHLPGLSRADRAQRAGRRARALHLVLGHAVVAIRADEGDEKACGKTRGKPVDFKELLGRLLLRL